MKSFRLRIAVFNTLISCLLLIAMAMASLFMLHRLKVNDLERDLREFAGRGIPRIHHLHAFQIFGKEIELNSRVEGSTRLPWLLLGKDQVVLYKSEDWPAHIDKAGIPTEQITRDLLRSTPPATTRDNNEIRPGEHNQAFQGAPPGNSGSRPPPHPQPGPVRNREPLQLLEIKTVGSPQTGQLLGIFQNEEVSLAVVGELSPIYALIKSSALAFIMSMPIIVILLIITSYWLSGKAIRPVLELTRSAASIDAGSLHERIDLDNADMEFERLACVFNEMLERLEKSFNQAKRFSSDAAHELKTPLAILQGELEEAIQESEDGSGQQQRLSDLTSEVQQLRLITTKLLYLSQADSGKLQLSKARISLSGLIQEVALDAELIAPHLSITTEIQPEINVDADPVLLGQIVHNLMSNAIKYNRDEGSVDIQLGQKDKTICLEISNTGEPIPKDAESRIFERFFRAAASHSSSIEGSGLGLSLAYEFTKAHKGKLILSGNEKDHISFRLTLLQSVC